MKRHHMIQKVGDIIVLPDLPDAGIEKRPADHDAQNNDDTAVQNSFGHRQTFSFMIRMALMMRDVVLRLAQRSFIYEPGRRRAFTSLLEMAVFCLNRIEPVRAKSR